MADGLTGVVHLAVLHAELVERPGKEPAPILLHPMGELLVLDPLRRLEPVMPGFPVVSCKLSRIRL